MQRKQQQKELPLGQNVMATILQSIPNDAKVTKIDYEGPRIALYTTSPRYLMEHNELISNLVNVIKKRIVVRTDESIRKLEEEARKILEQNIPKDAQLQSTFFDTATGEVSVEVKRPWLLQKNSDVFNQAELTESSVERGKQLKQVGEKIFRSRLVQRSEVSLLTLGGFGQVGRSCMLLTTPDSKILVDCGINPGARNPMESFPRLDWANI
jgi:predicted metal-dependent RNase